MAQLMFSGVPSRIQLPLPTDPIVLNDLSVPSDRLIAALVAAFSIALIAWIYQRSRTGVALRAIADDQQVAMAVGINVHRHLLLVWCFAGLVCVLAATLWTSVTGGSFGLALVGLRILPIVIIGGLDSIPGTIIAAVSIGVLECLAGGYLDPKLGGASGPLASYLALIAVLFVRPFGLFGREQVHRV
jgi:branched-chain amino acid transport system permease protein